MKAVRIHNYGGVDELKLEEAPMPSLGPDDVLVRVHAVGVNPFDTIFRQGVMKDVLPVKLPVVVGQDFAGDVADVGKNVTQLKKGDRVYGLSRTGSFAEYTAVPVSALARIPDTVDDKTAAALPVAGLTAYQLVTQVAKAAPGKTLLIHGAAGGVGAMAVQIAKAKGARVIATAAGEDADYLKQLGADVVVNYQTQRFEDFAKEVDAVIDLTRSADVLARSYPLVKKGGVITATANAIDEDKARAMGIGTAVRFLVKPNTKDFEDLVGLVAKGAVRPRMDKVLPLADVRQAQELIQTSKTHGKIVLTVA
ncbi:NADP-dependent oxidoreductase [Corallococcus sp. M34]|uniref:NADP-dependent oxidoreductase n=1 Tax=Citreicoccus inhibens TaxID=2849499 RepID=UPI001C20FEB1|nr:NADP-dependent oxidoreductase [Citreicoccus inhibens]MBU8899830.1 NADP-dependent oxidoreductase [Citreicoccus inhibens]